MEDFELKDQYASLKVEAIRYADYDSEMDWDKNWIESKITVRTTHFSGAYNSKFMTVDFEKFKQELQRLYKDLKGGASFNNLDGQLEIKINGDGVGHFIAECEARDTEGYKAANLTFEVGFDQTQIPRLLEQLNAITKRFPIKGEFDIKNE